jgi:hypothetical protein
MATLIEYGINNEILTELALLSKYNPEQNFLNNNIPRTPVSRYLLSLSKRPKKLEKVLKNIGIYNIIFINKDIDNICFMCKTRYGSIFKYEIPKSESKSIRNTCKLALLYFIDKIINKVESEEIVSSTEDNINNLDIQEIINNINKENMSSNELIENINDVLYEDNISLTHKPKLNISEIEEAQFRDLIGE